MIFVLSQFQSKYYKKSRNQTIGYPEESTKYNINTQFNLPVQHFQNVHDFFGIHELFVMFAQFQYFFSKILHHDLTTSQEPTELFK